MSLVKSGTALQLSVFETDTSSLKESPVGPASTSKARSPSPLQDLPPTPTSSASGGWPYGDMRYARVSTLNSNTPERSRAQLVRHQWEATVQSVSGESFSAILRSLSDPGSSEKVADIPVDDVNPDDLELLAPGAIFYWTVGQSVSPRGTVERFSSILSLIHISEPTRPY